MVEVSEFLDGALTRGVSFFAGVPCSYLTPLIDATIARKDCQYVGAANEGDAVALAAGAYLGGGGQTFGLAMMQNSGLGNAVSPLASLTSVFNLPLLLVVTLRGDPEHPDEPQHRLMGQVTQPLLELLEIPCEPFPSSTQDLQPTLDRARAYMTRSERPYALIMHKGDVAKPANPSFKRASPSACRPSQRASAWSEEIVERPTRTQTLARLLECTNDAHTVVIASTGYTGRELYALADRSNHLYMVGSMGCASSLALGLALTRPDLRVIVIDGDGAALMRMGNMATIGAEHPANLIHLLLDNEVHESTGAQATVAASMSFAQVAAACRYALVVEGDTLNVIDQVLDGNRPRGPRFGHLKIARGIPTNLPRPEVTPSEVRTRLMNHVGGGCDTPMPSNCDEPVSMVAGQSL